MKKINKNVTANVALSSQITSFLCDVIVTQNAVTSVNINHMSVTLRNKQGMQQKTADSSHKLLVCSLFVRSLFALCSLPGRMNRVLTGSL
jgi:hypothetical protein